jgi:hypothetical protein
MSFGCSVKNVIYILSAKTLDTYEVLIDYVTCDTFTSLIVVEPVVLEDSVLIVDPHDLQLDWVINTVCLLVLNPLLNRLDVLVVEYVQLALHIMEVAFDLETLQLFFDPALRENVF